MEGIEKLNIVKENLGNFQEVGKITELGGILNFSHISIQSRVTHMCIPNLVGSLTIDIKRFNLPLVPDFLKTFEILSLC